MSIINNRSPYRNPCLHIILITCISSLSLQLLKIQHCDFIASLALRLVTTIKTHFFVMLIYALSIRRMLQLLFITSLCIAIVSSQIVNTEVSLNLRYHFFQLTNIINLYIASHVLISSRCLHSSVENHDNSKSFMRRSHLFSTHSCKSDL